MLAHDLTWVLGRQGKAPIHFQYSRDGYAPMLLNWRIGDGEGVRALRATPFAKLLNKPCLRPVLSRLRSGRITPRDLRAAVLPQPLRYRITLGRWGEPDERKWCPSCQQTTTPGQNLVLQLNFAREHDSAYFGLIAPGGVEDHLDHPFVCPGHPVHERFLTMAWSRVDVNFSAGEALIEEIQSDWVKDAVRRAKAFRELDESELLAADLYGFDEAIAAYHVISYVDAVLQPHVGVWAEATLSATLYYLVEQLGIRRVFYNTFDTGCFLKAQKIDQPPRSLYTDLPRRFAFRETEQRPFALRRSRAGKLRDKLARKDLSWFLLEL